jgi:purine-nucleoside phosphorylase
MWDSIQESARYIRSKSEIKPELAIILGTGLGGLTDNIEIESEIHYRDIPHFPVSTVEGHAGSLILGTLAGKKVVAMKGRFHYYEGYSMREITLPIRVMIELGISTLMVSNASGGVNPEFEIGDIMMLTDHINLQPDNPLRGQNDDRLGPRFPDMSEPYDQKIIELTKRKAKELGITLRTGVYVSVPGPNFETPAEYKMMHIMGGDTVGMSTVPEVLVGRHAGIRCVGLSIITDLGVEGKIVPITHEEVQEVAAKSEKVLTRLVMAVIPEI